jgi:hypothetical protein
VYELSASRSLPGCHHNPQYFACSLTRLNSYSVLRLGFKCWQLACCDFWIPSLRIRLVAEHSAAMNGMNMKPSARKTHRKTRTGCRTCKSRKIKVSPARSTLCFRSIGRKAQVGSLTARDLHCPPHAAALLHWLAEFCYQPLLGCRVISHFQEAFCSLFLLAEGEIKISASLTTPVLTTSLTVR